MIFEMQNSSFANMKSYLDYPFERCRCGPLDCERRRVVLGPLFSQLRVILCPSLTSPEWRLFGRSGIMSLKIQNNFWIRIWEMQVGSRALGTLRHSFCPFRLNSYRLGLILDNPEWRWLLKIKFLHFKYEIFFGYPFESCTHGPNCKQRRVLLGLHFLYFRSF